MRANQDLRSERSATALWPFVWKASVLGGVLATTTSSVAFVGLSALGALGRLGSEQEAIANWWDIAKAAVLMCAITVVSCGPVGCVSAGLWAVILHLRRRRIRSLRRLMIESVLLAVLVTPAFAVYDVLLNSYPWHALRYEASGPQWMAIFVMCAASGVVFALTFRKRFASS